MQSLTPEHKKALIGKVREDLKKEDPLAAYWTLNENLYKYYLNKLEEISLQGAEAIEDCIDLGLKRGIEQFNAGRLDEPESLFGYIETICKRSYHQHLRKMGWGKGWSSEEEQEEDSFDDFAIDEDTQSATIDWKEEAVALWKEALYEISPMCKEMLVWLHGTNDPIQWQLSKQKPKSGYGRITALATQLMQMGDLHARTENLWLTYKWYTKPSKKPDIETLNTALRQQILRCSKRLVDGYSDNLKRLNILPQ